MTRASAIHALLTLGLLATSGIAQDEELPRPPRRVVVNLVVDQVSDAPVKLKTKTGAVLAESEEAGQDSLEFEVLIKGPYGDVAVNLPVPRNNTLYGVYERYKESDPEKILTFLDVIDRPCVRVVGMRRDRFVEYYFRTSKGIRRIKEPWRPFYEVWLPDADICEPVYAPVPDGDDQLHDTLYRTVAHIDPVRDVVGLMTVSGSVCEKCCPLCKQHPHSCDLHCAPAHCQCRRTTHPISLCGKCASAPCHCTPVKPKPVRVRKPCAIVGSPFFER